MEFYHSCYKFWRNFERKQDYCWIAITKTIPPDYVGNVYRDLAPIGKNFDEVENPFNEKLFFKEYCKLLKSLDKEKVLNDLKSFSKNGKDIVLLNWEDISKRSEGRFAFAWVFNLSMKDADARDIQTVLEMMSKTKDIIGRNFLTI